MSLSLTPGLRLRSVVCATQVIVVRASDADVTVSCGGAPMVPADGAPAASQGAPLPGFDGGTRIGKRYGRAELPVEVLCISGGDGSLSIGEHLLGERQAKPLPASD